MLKFKNLSNNRVQKIVLLILNLCEKVLVEWIEILGIESNTIFHSKKIWRAFKKHWAIG